MAVTPILIGRNMNFTRAYLSGFVGSAGVTNMVYSGSILHFDYLHPLYTVDLQIRVNVLAPSSNHYSLDYVFDWSSSQTYLSGNPIASSQGYRFVAMVSEPTWRIQILATLAIDETQRLDLAPLPGYWRPLA